MSDMEETEGHPGPAAPHRVIGTPPPSPRLLGSTAVAEDSGDAGEVAETDGEAHIVGLPPDDPRVIVHAKRVERMVAACFTFAFIAGCGFHRRLRRPRGAHRRQDPALQPGPGHLAWPRARRAGPRRAAVGAAPDAGRRGRRGAARAASDPKDRQAFEETFKEGTANSQFVKRPLVRRTLMLGTLPLLAAPVVLLRDMGPLPGTSLRHTVWSPGRRLLVAGTNQPLTPATFSAPGSMITIVPDGYVDDQDALTKATVILIKFRPGELDIPTTTQGGTLIGTMNWTVDNIVAYSKICTHVGCPVALYEQTTHHILCPCHQSTFDAAHGAEVIFGPAARPLPQLPMTVDAQGYLVARSDFTQPVGPSFWERG